MIAALATFLLANGCVSFGSKQIEKIPRFERKLRMPEAPPINLVLEHRPAEGVANMRKVFGKLTKKFPYLANAEESNPDAEHTLRLRIESEGEGCWPGQSDCTEAMGYTFWLIPAYEWSKWRYEATWEDASGDALYQHEGHTKYRMVTQFWLIWVSPLNAITMPMAPSDKKLMRRLLALIERDLAREHGAVARHRDAALALENAGGDGNPTARASRGPLPTDLEEGGR
jgi:hypothetical protein